MFLARFVPLLSTAAVKTLLNRSVSISELKELIRHVPKAHDAAIKVMLSRADELTEDDLRLLVTETKSPEIARLLIKRNPGDAVLGFVERTIESMKEYVDGIRKKESTSNVLREIDRLL